MEQYRRHRRCPPRHGATLKPLELVINDSYCGIFGLLEIIDRKLTSLNKNTDYIYHSVPLPEITEENYELYAGVYEGSPMGRITSFPEWDTDPWRALYDLVNVCYVPYDNGGNIDVDLAAQMVNMENFADYYLYLQMCYATDHRVRNTTYIAYSDSSAAGGLRFVRLPWDTNYTFGDSYVDKYFARTRYKEDWGSDGPVPELIFNFMFVSDPERMAALLYDRWQLLKTDALSAERIAERAGEMYGALYSCGATYRDTERWQPPHIGHESIDELTAQIIARGEMLDAYVEAVCADPFAEQQRLIATLPEVPRY